MKIVDAKPPKSKAQEYRDMAKVLSSDGSKAVYIELFSDVHAFGKTLKSIGLKATWRKQKSGGWLVWARK